MHGSIAWAATAGVLAGALPAAMMHIRVPRAVQVDGSNDWSPVLLPAWAWIGLAAAAGVVLGLRFAHSSALPAYLVLAACAAPLAAIDLASMLIPDWILGPSVALATACFAVASAEGGGAGSITRALLAALTVGSGFFALALFAGGGLGLGDCKLLAFVALICGYQSWGVVARALFAGFAIAALAGLIVRRVRGSRHLPLAPWLIGGALIALTL